MHQRKFNLLRQSFKAGQNRILPVFASWHHFQYLGKIVSLHLFFSPRTTFRRHNYNDEPD